MVKLLVVLSAPRSHETHVAAMLGQHPGLYALPEVNLLVSETMEELLAFFRIAGRKRMQGLPRAISQLYLQKQTEEAVGLALRWMLKNRELTTKEVLERLASKVEPKIVIESSAATTWKPDILERVEQTYPDARYLYVTRHPRSQGEELVRAVEDQKMISRMMMDNATDPPTFDPQIMWCNRNRVIQHFLSSVPDERKLTVHSESVLEDPAKGLAVITDWLGLETDEEATEAMRHPESWDFAAEGPPNAPFGVDQDFIESPQVPAADPPQSLAGKLSWRGDVEGFSKETIELARSLGYE